MVETSMNLFDLGVLIVVGLSALLSFFRGFVREILSLGAWLGAVVITLYMFPTASEYLAPHVGSTAIASGLASIGVFFVALIGISILTGLLLKFVKTGAEIGLLDNLVGLCFGVARGVFIVAIAYFIMSAVLLEKDYPEWVETSKSKPYVTKAAGWVGKLTPSYLDTMIKDGKKEAEDVDIKAGMKQIEHRIRSVDEEDMPAASLPSMEDLQRRIRQENERR